MNILTIDGYKNILDCPIGTLIKAYEVGTGNVIWNELLKIDEWTEDYVNALNENLPPECQIEWKWYLINGTYKIFSQQSIWNSPSTVCHAFELKIGDTFYSDTDEDLIIDTVEETLPENIWYRLEISGDHSFIADGFTQHNATRNWRGTTSTNWSTATNWLEGFVPTNADDAKFDNLGNNACTLTAASVCNSIAFTTGYTNTFNFSTFNLTISTNGSATLQSTATYQGSGTTLTTIQGSFIFAGNGNFTSNGASVHAINNAASSTITFTDAATMNYFRSSNGGTGIVLNADITINSGINHANQNNTFTYTGAYNVNIKGDFRCNNGTGQIQSSTGTKLIFNGTNHTLLSGATTKLSISIEFACSGNISITDTDVLMVGQTAKYTSGTFTSTTLGLGLCGGNLDFSGGTLPVLVLTSAGSTSNLLSEVKVSSTLVNRAYSTGGISLPTAASPITIKSNSAGTQRKLTLQQGATQDLGFTNFTDINAGDGQTIWVWKPTLSNTININSLTGQQTRGYAF